MLTYIPLPRIFTPVTLVLTLLTLCLTFPGQAAAHPHVFVETEIKIELNDKGLKGLWQEWTYDEFQSSWIIDLYNVEEQGQLSEAELNRLYRETFANLKNHDFFTRIILDEEKIPATEIDNFQVDVKDGLVTYSFFVPFELEIDRNQQELFILVYDENFFCRVFFPPEEISFTGNTSAWEIEHTTQKKPDLTYYFGMVTPKAIRLTLTTQ